MQVNDLEKLYELKEKGAISQEEYDTQKEAFLKQSVIDSASSPMVSLPDAYKSY